AAGQVNGLSVMSLGDFAFGRPSRVTASIGLGREGVIDIEREAKLGGRIHSKGVMILSGYLAEKYAQDKPLSLSARLVFEQSYEEVEGDSASSTEVYAVLSALSGLPIKQGIAVTGSVNQKGEVQAIGGVNQKIEGFFEVCKAQGLTGQQGVIIPESNIQNLMLRDEVVDAVKAGSFHIYPVKTIDEGIEVLTGVKAGLRQSDRTFDEKTVNYRVDKRLKEMADKLREFPEFIVRGRGTE
ncbi:MAG: ATP-dependent protease, partial [Candidatus Bathyarchaeota archaeon]|nr:ATP-dependent protease [Candidatus Bathyarchaeota archaeon]